MWQKIVVLGICAGMMVGCGDPDNSIKASSQQDEYKIEEIEKPLPQPTPEAHPTIDPFYGDCHGGSFYGCK
jgi:hypothetical protein